MEEADPMSSFEYHGEKKSKFQKIKSMITEKQPWKLDLNQATARQMINTLNAIENKYSSYPRPLPVVFSGHSKIFINYNVRSFEPLLKYAAKHKERFSFVTFRDIDTELYRE